MKTLYSENWPQLVESAIKRGWVKMPSVAMRHVENKTAELRKAMGLTARGTPRKKHLWKKHPALAGLKLREYQRKYMQLKRAGKI